MTVRTASTLTWLREPTAISLAAEVPSREYLPSSIAPALILEPSSAITRGTTLSSSGFTPLDLRHSLTFLPFSTVSSETTRTSTGSITSAGPYMSSITATLQGLPMEDRNCSKAFCLR